MKKTALAACPACARHVRLDEPSCPFCRAPLPSSFRETTAPPRSATRLSRAALYALGVGTLSMSSVACGGSRSGFEKDGGLPPGVEDAPSPDYDSQYGILYGLPGLPSPVDMDGGRDSRADAARDAGATDAQADASFPCGSVGAAYGGFPCIPFPVDASPAADASDAQPLIDAAYGGVPIEPEAGPTDGGAPE